MKPIISIKDGLVDTVDRVRTRTKARERAIEFIMADPIERLSVLHTVSPDVEAFRDELVARAPGGIDPARVSIELVGPSVGPHLGPGAVGAAVLRKRSELSRPGHLGRPPTRTTRAPWAERPMDAVATGPQRWRNRTATKVEPGGYTPDDFEPRVARSERARRRRPVGSSGRRPRIRPIAIRRPNGGTVHS